MVGIGEIGVLAKSHLSLLKIDFLFLVGDLLASGIRFAAFFSSSSAASAPGLSARRRIGRIFSRVAQQWNRRPGQACGGADVAGAGGSRVVVNDVGRFRGFLLLLASATRGFGDRRSILCDSMNRAEEMATKAKASHRKSDLRRHKEPPARSDASPELEVANSGTGEAMDVPLQDTTGRNTAQSGRIGRDETGNGDERSSRCAGGCGHSGGDITK